jgi:hypothetical protein
MCSPASPAASDNFYCFGVNVLLSCFGAYGLHFSALKCSIIMEYIPAYTKASSVERASYVHRTNLNRLFSHTKAEVQKEWQEMNRALSVPQAHLQVCCRCSVMHSHICCRLRVVTVLVLGYALWAEVTIIFILLIRLRIR